MWDKAIVNKGTDKITDVIINDDDVDGITEIKNKEASLKVRNKFTFLASDKAMGIPTEINIEKVWPKLNLDTLQYLSYQNINIADCCFAK